EEISGRGPIDPKDPNLAWDDLERRIARLTTAEAKRRYETDLALSRKGTVSKDQLEASFATWQRYAAEELELDLDPNAARNSIGFYPPAMALVVKAPSRIHTRLGGDFGAPNGSMGSDATVFSFWLGYFDGEVPRLRTRSEDGWGEGFI